MTALAIILGATVLVLLIAMLFARAAMRRAVEREAARLAESYAVEVRRQADKRKAEIAAETAKAIEETKTMTNELLEAEINK